MAYELLSRLRRDAVSRFKVPERTGLVLSGLQQSVSLCWCLNLRAKSSEW